MTGSVYLIGGGEIRDGDTYLIDEEIKSLAPQGATFVFFGFASQDNTEYSHTIKSVFGNKFKILIPTKRKGRDYAVKAIRSSSVIYLGGGDTDLLMQRFSDWNLVEHLLEAHARGVHIAGMSAGAQALSSWYVHEDNDVFEIRKGWGIAPVGALVHAKQKSLTKAKSLWRSFDGAGKCSLVAIGERAAWRIDSDGEHKVGRGEVWRQSLLSQKETSE